MWALQKYGEPKWKKKWNSIELLCFAPVLKSVFFHILRIERRFSFGNLTFQEDTHTKAIQSFIIKPKMIIKMKRFFLLNELRLCALNFDWSGINPIFEKRNCFVLKNEVAHIATIAITLGLFKFLEISCEWMLWWFESVHFYPNQ